MNEKINRNVKILTGDPKKAIIKLSIPMMIGNLVQTLYNVVDGIWVSGVSGNSLAAVGLFMPFMMIFSALVMGIGVGGSSAISRAIGAKNRKRASNVAEHTLIFGLLIGTLLGYSFLPFLNTVFLKMGAGQNVSQLAADYGRVIILGTPLIFLSSLGSAILRGEGDTKRTMYVMVGSSIMNMVLDPIFIYSFNMGIVGAAVATMISIAFSAIIMTYWLIFKKDTYVQLKLTYFKPKKDILREILSVGLPSSLAQISTSLTMILLNTIVLMAGGDYGMAVFSGGWRIVMMGNVPLMGMVSSATSVMGAAYGARDSKKLKSAYLYAVKIGTLIGLLSGVIIGVFAPQITYLFTYSEKSSYLAPGIVEFLRYIVFLFPGSAAAMFTSSLFRGIGKGMYSLTLTIIRSVIMQLLFTYLFGIALGMGLRGIWLGIVIANIISSLIALAWGLHTLKKVESMLNLKTSLFIHPSINPKSKEV